MTEHTELPELAVGYMNQGLGHGHYAVLRKESGKLFAHVPFGDKNLALQVVLACNSYEDLLAACKNAVKQMEDEPVQAGGEWEQGLFCGLEDMGITDRYAACRHGYDKALEKVQEWIIDELEAAIEKAEVKP